MNLVYFSSIYEQLKLQQIEEIKFERKCHSSPQLLCDKNIIPEFFGNEDSCESLEFDTAHHDSLQISVIHDGVSSDIESSDVINATVVEDSQLDDIPSVGSAGTLMNLTSNRREIRIFKNRQPIKLDYIDESERLGKRRTVNGERMNSKKLKT
jgi:hypothetical protein